MIKCNAIADVNNMQDYVDNYKILMLIDLCKLIQVRLLINFNEHTRTLINNTV
jgi:hypothetical protein